MGRRELTCLLVPAAHDKLDHLLAIESILVTHNAERSEAPIYGIHTQVGSEMVHQVIFALWRVRRTAFTGPRTYAPPRATGCI